MTDWLAVIVALVLVGPLWTTIGTHIDTVVHEGGHAAMSLALGGRVEAVRVYAGNGGSGETSSWNERSAQLPVCLAGHLAPSAVGLGALLLLHHQGNPAVALGALLVALAGLLLVSRSLFGLCFILLLAIGTYAAVRYGSVDVQTAILTALGWTLLGGAVRSAPRIWSEGSDADGAYQATGISPAFWALLVSAGCMAALGYAGWLTLAR